MTNGNGTHSAAANAVSREDAKAGQPRILLVDDRRENLLALAAVLEPLEQQVVLARSGAEALKHLLTDDFALILLDVQMPDMDGFETAAIIKQREKSRYIPIIFVTAISREEQYVFQGYQTGAVDYLSKPVDPDVLRSKVTVFVELYQQSQKIREQAEALRQAELREAALQRDQAERERERQYVEELASRETQLRQFKATLDATLDAVFLFDPETLRFFYVNEGAVSLLGYTSDELLQKTPLDLDADSDPDQLRRILVPLMSEGNIAPASHAQTYETRLRQRSGLVVPVEVMVQYVAPPEGGKARFVSIVRDVSERKLAEAQLALLYEREKKIAQALQQSIVNTPPEDLFPGLHIDAKYEAAWDEASVGGDYLDFFALEKGRVALVVGDVSGKGLAAAARTAEVKYALRAFLRETPDPARALTRLNTLLCDTSRLESSDSGGFPGPGHFICLSVAVVAPQTGETIFALAGAEPPLILRASGKTETVTGGGMPVGIDAAESHLSTTWQLERGDMLLMLTDGITEARQGREFFGYDGFTNAVSGAAPGGSVQQVAKSVLEAARNFAGGKLHDDACLLLAARY
ncbi:MAG: SpoIIE family protein phosphatase [Cytophagales bacterium]|nr:SpoIIE family protein phosphatase [Armatimonadota bacterium]